MNSNSENPKNSAAKTFPCNEVLRAKLRAMRDTEDSIWSNAELGKKLGYSAAVISQYLSDDGCKYNVQGSGQDGVSLEQKVEDFLQALERRRSSGVETHSSEVASQILEGFDLIRKTNDLGAVIGDSGEGKTRGIEMIRKAHPLTIVIEIAEWCCDKWAVMSAMWAACPHDGWDRTIPQFPYLVQKMRGSDRPLLFDDAHKLSRPALALIASFQEKTGCPIVLVGCPELVKKLESDSTGQTPSRVGVRWAVKLPKSDSKLLKHMIQSVAKTVNGELDEMVDLCRQVAAHPGRYRAVYKQLRVAANIRLGDDKYTWCEAFKAAHKQLGRAYPIT